MLLFLLCLGCAAENAEEVQDPVCCREKLENEPPGVDFASTVEAPQRCLAAAQRLLPSDEAWHQLWGCVEAGHFTALRELLAGPWDRDLQTRPDAPQLVLRVIAQRGGLVDDDLSRLHERRVPLFSLSQALARPALYRGALIIARARLSPQGVLDETRLVSRSAEAQVGTASIIHTAAPYSMDSRQLRTTPRWYNLDVATGQRALAVIDGDPFLDAGEAVVVLARFDGLRDSDGWPQLSVVSHLKPAATLSY